MKRNYPPDSKSSVEAHEGERVVIGQRLDELYSTHDVRKVPRSSITIYRDKNHHVRLDEGANLSHFAGYSQYSKELGYHYLEPFPALYSMESRKSLICHNELPLSLSEAYHLLLRNQVEFQSYVVFSFLNRNGYYCLNPSSLAKSPEQGYQQFIEQPLSMTGPNTEPLFELDSCRLAFDKVLNKLREQGPKDLTLSDLRESQTKITITFDAYKRETFSSRKPRPGRSGTPDYYVVIQDKRKTSCPSPEDFLALGDEELCSKLLFAIIDGYSSLSFVDYSAIDKNILNLNIREWPESIDDARLIELNRSF